MLREKRVELGRLINVIAVSPSFQHHTPSHLHSLTPPHYYHHTALDTSNYRPVLGNHTFVLLRIQVISLDLIVIYLKYHLPFIPIGPTAQIAQTANSYYCAYSLHFGSVVRCTLVYTLALTVCILT